MGQKDKSKKTKDKKPRADFKRQSKKFEPGDVAKNASKFSQGDVVKLNSGGPEMTVDRILGDKVDVVWIDEGQMVLRDTFSEAALEGPLKSANKF